MKEYFWYKPPNPRSYWHYVEKPSYKVVGSILEHDGLFSVHYNQCHMDDYASLVGAQNAMIDHFKEKDYCYYDCGCETSVVYTPPVVLFEYAEMKRLLTEALRLHHATMTYMGSVQTSKFHKDSEKFINDLKEILK